MTIDRDGPAESSSALSGDQAPKVWRSLDEHLGTALSADLLAHELQRHPIRDDFDASPEDTTSRRHFLRLMGASMALSGAAGCAFQPPESIVPYVEQPESIVPGKPLFFASAMELDGFASGILVESHSGRPIKIEGNPVHPSSQGATDALTQAAILSLYDPDRSQVVLSNGRVTTWDRFQSALVDIREQQRTAKGRGLRILTSSVGSPTLNDQLTRLLEQFPEARWHSYAPVCRESIREGALRAFGEALEPVYHFDKADVVVALDADFLASGPGHLRYTRDLVSRRAASELPSDTNAPRIRLYAVECTPSLTGALADHRFPIQARHIGSVARALAQELKIDGIDRDDSQTLGKSMAWISALANDLKKNHGKSLVIAGFAQPASVHVVVHLINHALGNFGQTISFHSRGKQGPSNRVSSLAELAADLHRGAVDTLLISGANPVYDAPVDLGLASLLSDPRRPLRIHLGLYQDETAELCQWHIPEAHFLETWSDCRALDGTVTIQQPLIAPLYHGRSAHELLAGLLGEPARTPLEIVRDYWRRELAKGDFDSLWRQALQSGVVAGTAIPARSVELKRDEALAKSRPDVATGESGLELVFRPDFKVWDGRFANNGWLQELPDPFGRLTWGNAALLSPALAKQLGINSGDVVALRYRGRELRLPACIMPGQAERSVTITLGYGRTRSGRIGNGVGASSYLLRTSDALWFGDGLEVVPTGEHEELATVQHHHVMEGRDLVRVGTIGEYRRNPSFAQEPDRHVEPNASLYPDPPRGADAENAWGMVIDLDRCIGCAACVMACQAENNIPIVGKEEVLRSRELHWLRIDRYYDGDPSDPRTYFQPVPCMHCEKAPCELVCPVGATTHSDEGLNEMTYNRCVGTRYCSNNCPYKVRRFNFFQYADESTPSLKLLRNPDVTVRPRGVMEKCTYCVQRINQARIHAKIENRPVGGDEVVTACQSVCPAQAIIFGNLADSTSAVARAKTSPRNYALLAELNTKPRTTYLARLGNPSEEISATHEYPSGKSDVRIQ
jgi:MoCo/4Fe-4S cofactor protein with predicted Tat translocation signal